MGGVGRDHAAAVGRGGTPGRGTRREALVQDLCISSAYTVSTHLPASSLTLHYPLSSSPEDAQPPRSRTESMIQVPS